MPYFYVRELENWSFNPHLHLFLSGTSDLNPTRWKQYWFSIAGLAEKIEPYNPDLGAKYYLGSELPCAKSTGRRDAPQRNLRRFIPAAETAGCSRF